VSSIQKKCDELIMCVLLVLLNLGLESEFEDSLLDHYVKLVDMVNFDV
jgi:hypothetical protein